jgi:hypothetical protein
MGQFSLDRNAGRNEPGEAPGANAAPDSVTQSSGSQLAGVSNPVGEAARSADATPGDASLGGGISANPQPNSANQSYASQNAQSLPSLPAQFDQNAEPPASPQSAVAQRPADIAPVNNSDTLSQGGASGAASIPRQRQPVKQIGQIPVIDDTQLLQRYASPPPQTAAEAEQQHAAWMQLAQQFQAQQQQIARINQGDPYISDEDGRWKKQTADPTTGAVHEMDVLDTGSGKIDRGTGNIYVPTSQGPQVIGVDPQQNRLAQMVAQKAQTQAAGSQIAADIAAAQSALFDTQQQLTSIQGVPDRLNAAIAKYTQASIDPTNTAAAGQLKSAQDQLSAWEAQNPQYKELTARRDALSAQVQAQTAANAQNDAQVAQWLTTPQYVQWNGNLPPSTPSMPPQQTEAQSVPSGGQSPSPASPEDPASPATQSTSPATPGAPGASASSPDITIHDADARAGVIAAQTGLPPALAYASALREAKQAGAQTVDGAAIDDALQSLQPSLQSQLARMSPPQLRQAFQSGLISKADLRNTVAAQDGATLHPNANGLATGATFAPNQADNGVSRPVDLAMRAFAENDRFLYRSGEYLARLISGDSAATNWLKQNADAAESLG